MICLNLGFGWDFAPLYNVELNQIDAVLALYGIEHIWNDWDQLLIWDMDYRIVTDILVDLGYDYEIGELYRDPYDRW